jgi:acetyltransferase-like isoleucine patch superfamily enzyme
VAAVKTLVRGAALAGSFLPAAASAFGRWKAPFTFFAHAFALLPGLPGDYLRMAFYHLTLAECPLSGRVSFGSFFAHPEARVGTGVYIGSYCIIGMAEIGARSQIASGVQILSGARQHARTADGRISGAEEGAFTPVRIGADCWIGAGAIVMADVGEASTIGAGSVVTRAIPGRATAVGSPARVVQSPYGAGWKPAADCQSAHGE